MGDATSEEDAASLGLQETDLLGTAEYVPTSSNVDEVFAFSRTLSRLREMGSPSYLQQVHRGSVDGPSPVRFFTNLTNHSGDAPAGAVSHKLSDGDVRTLFDRFDANEDGVIDAKEVKRMLEEITLFLSGHKHVPDEVYSSTLEALDADRDGTVSWTEFQKYFSKYGLQVRG